MAMASAALVGSTSNLSQRRQHLCAKTRGIAAKRGVCRGYAAASTLYKVTFKLPCGKEETIQCPPDKYILDAADASGLELPIECSAGNCSSCAGRILSGVLDQRDQCYLDEEQIGKGFAMLCTSYPQSDCVIQIEEESVF